MSAFFQLLEKFTEEEKKIVGESLVLPRVLFMRPLFPKRSWNFPYFNWIQSKMFSK